MDIFSKLQKQQFSGSKHKKLGTILKVIEKNLYTCNFQITLILNFVIIVKKSRQIWNKK